MTQKDYINGALEQFADLVIEQMNSMKSANWSKPWFTERAMLPPMNLRGTGYTGANQIMLMIHSQAKGYTLPIFGTFKQLNELNESKTEEQGTISVKKGEKSFPVFHTSVVLINNETGVKISLDDYKKLSVEEKKGYRIISHYNVYRVFNVSQTNLEEARPELFEKITSRCHMTKPEVSDDDGVIITPIDKMLKTSSWLCPISFYNQDRAFYSITSDNITLPLREQFISNESFYGTLLHEMAHSTG